MSPDESKSKPKPSDGWRLAWRRLGDPGVISWPAFWATLAVAAADALTTLSDVSVAAAITGAVVAQLVIFAILVAARFSYLPRAFARRHPIIMLFTIIVASIVGVIVGQIAQRVVEPPTTDWGVIAVDGAIFRIVTIVIVGIFAVSLRDYRKSIADLEAVQERLLATREAGEETFQQERDDIFARVTTMMTEALAKVSAERPAEAERVLRTSAEDMVRPLSHELAMTAPKFAAPSAVTPPGVTWRSVLDEVTATPIIRPVLTAIAVAVFSIRFTVSAPPEELLAERGIGDEAAVVIDLSSFGLSLIFLVATFLAVLLGSLLVNGITRRFLGRLTLLQRFVVMLISAFAVIGILQVVIQLLLAVLPDTTMEEAFWLRLLSVIPVFIVAVVVGTVRAVSARWSLTRRSLEEANDDLSWEVAKIREALWQQRRSLARALHGPLKSAINAGTIQIQAAAAQGEVPAAVIDAVRANISAALGDVQGSGNDPVDLDHHIELLERTWAGICELHIDAAEDVLDRLRADHICAAATVDIVGEAVANAAIHAGAKNAWITMAMDGHRVLQITVRDDGRTGGAEPVPGLGSQILDEVCTDWDLDVQGTGSTLRAALPIA